MARRGWDMELEAFEDNLWVDQETGCYEWTGGKATNGYGIFHADGASWYAIGKLLGYAQQTVKRAVEKYKNTNQPIIPLLETA